MAVVTAIVRAPDNQRIIQEVSGVIVQAAPPTEAIVQDK